MRKKDWIISAVIIVVLYSIFLFGRSRSYSYGFAFNDERKRLGVPLIDQEWRDPRNVKDSAFWFNPSHDVPRHSLKELSINKYKLFNFGVLDIERDEFVLLKDQDTVTLECFYHYDENCYNTYLQFDPKRTGNPITCAEANKLLTENGFDSLKYCKPCKESK